MHASPRLPFRIALLILAVCALPQVAADDDVGDRFSVRGQLELTADALRETLTVVSPEHGFTLALPFSDSWKFETDTRQPLGASDDRLTLDVRPRKLAEEDPWSQLDEYLDELIVSRADVRFAQIVEEDDRHVACVQVRTAEDAPWRWFYWTVIPSQSTWLQLTMIDTATQELEPYDIDLVRRLASSFATIETDDEETAER